MEEKEKEKGLRFDQGKLRYDLVNTFAHEQMVRVLTYGATKYSDRNWEKGMEWSKIIGPLKRHIAAIEKGEDFDIDPTCPECAESTQEKWICTKHSGLLHAAHVACNAHFLTAYYKIFPQGDDRPHRYLNMPKIGLDIDEVLCNWIGHWAATQGIDQPKCWHFDRELLDKFERMKGEDKLDEFYANLQPLIGPEELPFEPHCYITSRPIDTKITEEWLDKHGFPARPVYTTAVGQSKVKLAQDAGVEIFVDDNYDNFVALNNAGICCFLMDAPHNQRYNVGYKRIKSLKELI